MIVPKGIADIQSMIRDQVQENIHLDYKRSAAIRKNARDEIAKDVSAFANSDGGVLLYGVEEKEHLPVKIDGGVDDAECSREWIESAITTGITPRLNDVRILPLPISPGRSLYVVEIAKTFRGPHQASDKRYYKRHNFKSEPMEDYEIADVRNRRKHVSPLIVFEIGEYRRFIAAFDVGNVSDLVAEDVRFEFPKDMPWPLEQKMPFLFANGMSKFPPRQRFRFLLCPFHEILSGSKGVPKEFSVRISYYHPEAASRVTDEWYVNFAAYEHSMAVRPEIEEQAKDMVERFDKLNQHFDTLNKTLENFKTIPGSTGLDLSIPTLRNLKRVLVEGGEPEAIHPQGCDWRVFKELLGVDLQMAFSISRAFESQDSLERLRNVPGMTEEILSKIRRTFIVEPEETTAGLATSDDSANRVEELISPSHEGDREDRPLK
jgi:hypothetical protein